VTTTIPGHGTLVIAVLTFFALNKTVVNIAILTVRGQSEPRNSMKLNTVVILLRTRQLRPSGMTKIGIGVDILSDADVIINQGL
jgi:hypothetical protein